MGSVRGGSINPAAVGELVYAAVPHVPVDRPRAVFVTMGCGTHRNDLLGRALDVDHGLAGAILVQRGHEPVLGIEGNGVVLGMGLAQRRWVEPHLAGKAQQCAFHRVAGHRPYPIGFA